MTAHTSAAAAGDTPGRAARPERPAGYWERVDQIVAQAPPLDDAQRARLRVIFHQAAQREEKAA